MAMCLGDNHDAYPQWDYSKNHRNAPGRRVHWPGMVLPHIKNLNIVISPGDKIGGFAPANYSLASENKGWGWPSGQTPQYDADIGMQAPRLSYIGNSLLMPRKRKSADPMSVTIATAIEEVGQIILFGAMAEYAARINGSSVASGQACRTHRPANAAVVEGNGAPFHGEVVDEVGRLDCWMISCQRAMVDIESCKSGTPATGLSHITYITPDRFGKGSNYTYADTHARFAPLQDTLNPSRFPWGKRAYTAGGGLVLKPGTYEPVE